MSQIPQFSPSQLESISKSIGDTSSGLTGSEIGEVLRQCQIEDIDPLNTKWRRINNALANKQNQDKCGNNIIAFIKEAMSPSRHLQKPDRFNSMRSSLNEALSLCGYHLEENGEVILSDKVYTVDEAKEKADRLRSELLKRKVHPDVLLVCQTRFLNKDYFYAVLEATKSIADKIREKSGIDADGSKLIDLTLEKGQNQYPLLAFNSLQSVSEQNEHKGMTQLIRGLFAAFRNPTSHELEMSWHIDETDALDILTIASLIHRRIDKAIKTR